MIKKTKNAIKDSFLNHCFYNEYEANMMSLLNEIEVLGDYREIPMLKIMRHTEETHFIKNRINSIISKFTSRNHS